MSRIYITRSLKTRKEVRLMERTTFSGSKYAIFVDGVLKANAEALCDAYREYNRLAAQ